MANLHQWLLENNFFQKSDDAPKASHLSYKGESIYVPRSKEQEFLTKYAEDFQNGCMLDWIEVRPEIHKFIVYISVDMIFDENGLINFVKFIQQIVSEFVNDDDNSVLCLRSSKPSAHEHSGVLHLIWPKVLVNSIIEHVILTEISERMLANHPLDWKFLSEMVKCTGVGCRMVGSSKNIYENKKLPFRLMFVLDSKGELDQTRFEELQNDKQKLVEETSIRLRPTSFKQDFVTTA